MKQDVAARIRMLTVDSDRRPAIHLDGSGERVREVSDLEADSYLYPKDAGASGPFDLTITVRGVRLLLEMQDTAGNRVMPALGISLRPYRRLIRDYFMMVESYEQARREGAYHKLEAIDAGRRGLHDEGAQYLQYRLSDKLAMDFETARRLFALFAMLSAGERDAGYLR